MNNEIVTVLEGMTTVIAIALTAVILKIGGTVARQPTPDRRRVNVVEKTGGRRSGNCVRVASPFLLALFLLFMPFGSDATNQMTPLSDDIDTHSVGLLATTSMIQLSDAACWQPPMMNTDHAPPWIDANFPTGADLHIFRSVTSSFKSREAVHLAYLHPELDVDKPPDRMDGDKIYPGDILIKGEEGQYPARFPNLFFVPSAPTFSSFRYSNVLIKFSLKKY